MFIDAEQHDIVFAPLGVKCRQFGHRTLNGVPASQPLVGYKRLTLGSEERLQKR
jgi:hypothetical protein